VIWASCRRTAGARLGLAHDRAQACVGLLAPAALSQVAADDVVQRERLRQQRGVDLQASASLPASHSYSGIRPRSVWTRSRSGDDWDDPALLDVLRRSSRRPRRNSAWPAEVRSCLVPCNERCIRADARSTTEVVEVAAVPASSDVLHPARRCHAALPCVRAMARDSCCGRRA